MPPLGGIGGGGGMADAHCISIQAITHAVFIVYPFQM
jgi:hypothetical protein